MEQEQKQKIKPYTVKWAIMNDGKHRSTNAYPKNHAHACDTSIKINKVNTYQQQYEQQQKAHGNKVTKTNKRLPFGPLMFTKKFRKNG